MAIHTNSHGIEVYIYIYTHMYIYIYMYVYVYVYILVGRNNFFPLLFFVSVCVWVCGVRTKATNFFSEISMSHHFNLSI